MKVTQQLMNEHAAVIRAMQLLEKVEKGLAEKAQTAPEQLLQLLDFFKGFVDKCHHGKEEKVLFPEMEKRGVKREGGALGVMFSEHEAGRQQIRKIEEEIASLRRGDLNALDRMAENCRAYRDLLAGHIDKETRVLFPMADRLIPEDAANPLILQYEAIEREQIGEGKHEMYHAMLQKLDDTLSGRIPQPVVPQPAPAPQPAPFPPQPPLQQQPAPPVIQYQQVASAASAVNTTPPVTHPYAPREKITFGKLADMVTWQPGAVISREIIKKDAGTITIFSFDKDQGLSEHTAPFDAMVLILEGMAEITIGGSPFRLIKDEMIIMPANIPHAVKAMDKFKMLLVMIK